MDFVFKKYLFLSNHIALDKAGSFLYDFFIGAFLFSAGWSLTNIIFFFLIELGVRGLFHFISPFLIKHLKLNYSVLVSYISISIFFVLFAMFPNRVDFILYAVVLHSFGRGLYYPIMYYVKSFYVESAHRGRFYSLEVFSVSIFSILATWLGSIALDIHVAWPVIGSIIIMFMAWMLLFFVTKQPKNTDLHLSNKSNKELIESFKKTITGAGVGSLIPYLFAKGTWVILKLIYIPLFLYIATESFSLAGFVFALALAVEFIFLYFVGNGIDSHRKVTLGVYSSMLLLLIIFGFAFSYFLTNIVVVTLLVVLWRIFSHGYRSIIEVGVQNSIHRDGHPFFLASLQEGLLCWIEVILLVPLAVLSLYGTGISFMTAYLFGIIGIAVFIIKLSKGVKIG